MSKYIDADKLKRHYAWWDDEEKKIFDEIIDLQPAADVEPAQHWIPVRWESLPEDENKVLCCTVTAKGMKGIVLGYYSRELERWVCGMNSNVIAWMPLPEPYKGGEEE